MWLILALVALLCWSGSDFFSKIGSLPDDKNSHFKMVMAVGLVMGLHAVYEMVFNDVVFTLDVFVQYLPVSILYIGSMMLGYVGLRYIELSVSSPICNSSGALAALMCFLVLGQTMDTLQSVAVGIVCVGVLGLGIVQMTEDEELRLERQKKSNIKYSKSIIALLFPILYCLLDAAGTFADALVLESLDENAANVAYELTFLLMGVLCFIYVVFIKREKLLPQREWPKLVAAGFETAGQVAYIFAIAANAVGAAPVISAYCVASAVWSHIFLKERLSWKHYLTIGIVVLGIILLGVSEGLSGDA